MLTLAKIKLYKDLKADSKDFGFWEDALTIQGNFYVKKKAYMHLQRKLTGKLLWLSKETFLIKIKSL